MSDVNQTKEYLQGYAAYGAGQKMAPYDEDTRRFSDWHNGWSDASMADFKATEPLWEPHTFWGKGFQAKDRQCERVSLNVFSDMNVWRWSVIVNPYQQASENLAMGMSKGPDEAKSAIRAVLRSPEYKTALGVFQNLNVLDAPVTDTPSTGR